MLKPTRAAHREITSRVAEIATTRYEVLSALKGGDYTVESSWSHVNGFIASVGSDSLKVLRAHPKVLAVGPVGGAARAMLAQSVALIGGAAAHDQDWNGENVKIAIIDSGVDSDHDDLRGAVVDEHCFCPNCCPDGSSEMEGKGAAKDEFFHGTHVAGIAVGRGMVASMGMAPKAKIVAVRILDKNGNAEDAAQQISGLNWVLEHHPDTKAVNFSITSGALFNGACDDSEAWTMMFSDALAALHANGTLVFAAPGNNANKSQMGVPACLEKAVSVGAVCDSDFGPFELAVCSDPSTQADLVTCYSNSSPMLDIYAPGSVITAANLGGGTRDLHGTSMSTPHATGAAALLWQANPDLSADEVENLLKDTGVTVSDPRAGGIERPRIDVSAAIDAALDDDETESTDSSDEDISTPSEESETPSTSDEVTDEGSESSSSGTPSEGEGSTTTDEDSLSGTDEDDEDDEDDASSSQAESDDDDASDDDDDENADGNGDNAGCGCSSSSSGHALGFAWFGIVALLRRSGGERNKHQRATVLA
jgi:MYXO-CTERM domain-containing protein